MMMTLTIHNHTTTTTTVMMMMMMMMVVMKRNDGVTQLPVSVAIRFLGSSHSELLAELIIFITPV